MTSLPLFGLARTFETEVMSSENSRPTGSISTGSLSPGRRSWPQLLRSVSHSIAAAVAECHRATGTMMQLRLAPDRYMPNSAQAPDDYAEFLFRTSGPLRHEPSARQRAAGRSLR